MNLVYLDESGNTGTNLSDPQQPVFVLAAQVVNEFLRATPGSPLGILISDENHEVMPDIEKSIRLLRGEAGSLRLLSLIHI
jgi:hypothetical protein